MPHSNTALFPALRRQAHRLLPLLFVGLISLQAQAACAMVGDLESARADVAWVMHEHGSSAQADLADHNGHAGHGVSSTSVDDGSTGCPGCVSHDGDCEGGTCLQVVTASPEGSVTKTDFDHQPVFILPIRLATLAPTDLPNLGIAPRTEFIPERPPRLRFVRFLE